MEAAQSSAASEAAPDAPFERSVLICAHRRARPWVAKRGAVAAGEHAVRVMSVRALPGWSRSAPAVLPRFAGGRHDGTDAKIIGSTRDAANAPWAPSVLICARRGV